MISNKSISQWCESHPLIVDLMALKETCWFNPQVTDVEQALPDVGLSRNDVADASDRLERFSAYIQRVYPETRKSGGIIESPLVSGNLLQDALAVRYQIRLSGNLMLKLDSHLPVSGSIKARGGIYEVLKHAENLAIKNGMLSYEDDYSKLDSEEFRQFFGKYYIAVGSTGNLGLSIGIISARLGFRVTVHMSADARQWKKDLLRNLGVSVVEYKEGYGRAVEERRRQAEANPDCHFVDDEKSTDLFLGYAVAGERLKKQLADQNIKVDKNHPLFVYLPCGVGGGPGGVAFGLKLAFGDAVHCIFAEPTHSPCMMLGVYTGLHDKVYVQDFGIDNLTAADGLAVGRASGFVGRAMQRMLDGYYTTSDEELYCLGALLVKTEGILLEPSALAGMPSIAKILREQQGYRERMGLSEKQLRNATHIVWAIGGGMVPACEMAEYINKGNDLLNKEKEACTNQVELAEH